MKKQQKMRLLKVAAISSAAVGLAACSHQDWVACYGLHTVDGAPYVVMDKGLCEKLADGCPRPLPADAVIPKVDDNDYVMCYGVVAAGKNDCGTKTTACAGTVKKARDPSGWIAALEGVCKEIGGRVGEIKKVN